MRLTDSGPERTLLDRAPPPRWSGPSHTPELCGRLCPTASVTVEPAVTGGLLRVGCRCRHIREHEDGGHPVPVLRGTVPVSDPNGEGVSTPVQVEPGADSGREPWEPSF